MKKVLLALMLVMGFVALGVPASADDAEPSPEVVLESPAATEEATAAEDAPAAEETPATEEATAPAPAVDETSAPAETVEPKATVALVPPPVDEAVEKVEICHAAAAFTNPYIKNEPNVDANADPPLTGHGGHTDPIWDPFTMQQGDDWGDIIPPFSYMDGDELKFYPGLNWTELGQAFYANDCDIPPIVAAEPTVTAATCEAAGEVVLPESDFVQYEVTDNGDGTVTVVATLVEAVAEILELTGDTEWTLEVPAQLTGDECEEDQGVSPKPVEKDPKDVAPALPNTGGPSLAILWLGALSAAAGGLMVARRRATI